MERTNAWTKYDEKTVADVMRTAGDYIAFLNRGKTERECAAQAVQMAKAEGRRIPGPEGRHPRRQGPESGGQGLLAADEQGRAPLPHRQTSHG